VVLPPHPVTGYRLAHRPTGQPGRPAGPDRQVVAAGYGRDYGVDFRQVGGTELVSKGVLGAVDRELGVTDRGGGQRRVQHDVEAALTLDRETSCGETSRPVLMHVHASLVASPRRGGVDAVLQGGARWVGKETRERIQFDHGEQSPRAQRRVDLTDGAGGIAHVVQRLGGPHQVSGPDLGPGLIEISLDSADPVRDAQRAGLVLEAVEHLRVNVQRDHLGVRQLPGQRQSAGSGAGPDIDHARLAGEAGGCPGDRLPVLVAQHLRVKVKDFSCVIVCHAFDGTATLLLRHNILRMKQDADLDALVRQRIRGLRMSLGWSLDELAERSYLSPSTLSRIETGHRRIALDQLTPIARALGTTLDQLVESADDADVVIRPHRDEARGMTTWLLSRTGAPQGVTIAKLRVTRKVPDRLRVHPGRDWFTVLSGTIVLRLNERTILVQAGEAAEFSTMEPHAFGALDGPAEMLCILDHDGTRTHLGPSSSTADEP
jgi:transcriptional regulator with XRE-family HTH domain